MLKCVLSLKEDIENFEWSLSLSTAMHSKEWVLQMKRL